MGRFQIVFTAALLLFNPARAGDAASLTQDGMRQAAESFYSVGLDAARAYAIPSARLQRDRLSINLEGGTLVLAQPILGRVTGACYLGKARLALTPPTPTERASLKARTGSEEFNAEVEALYLRFNDTTAADLTAGLSPAPVAAALERCSKIFSSRNDVVRKYEESTIRFPFTLEMDLLEDFLSPSSRRQFFVLEAEVNDHGWVTYLQRPGYAPHVVLARFKPMGTIFDPEPWVTHTMAGGGSEGIVLGPSVDILHNEMEIVIPDREAFTIDALLTWRSALDLRSARFALINSFAGTTWDDIYAKPVTVDSVTTTEGSPLPFVHRQHELLVALPTPVPAGRDYALRIKAREKTILQITPESYMLLSTWPWFPQETLYLGGFYTFDWTVKVLKPLTAAGTGITVREWEDKDARLNCAQWKSESPVTFPSLIFGQYKETKGEYRRRSDGKPVHIRLHWMPKVTLDEEIRPADYEIVNPGDKPIETGGVATHVYSVPLSKPPQVVKDAARILDYYEQVFAPYPREELDLAQMAPYMWFAQAPPGLVQITGEYFLSQGLIGTSYAHPTTMDFLKTVLAHEIAHHYWGDVVSWKSADDQWLSESLAEYSSGLFLQAADGDKAFRQQLSSWRKTAERWEGRVPIAHAHRASGETAAAVRFAMLYNKGPLVLHMLRTQVGNDIFVKILQKTLTDYRGLPIDTQNFQAAAEAVAGYRLDWFFDQWVRGTGIPELSFSYEVTPAAGGKFLFKGRVAQADRSNPKALFLPVMFDFGGGQTAPKEWRVKGAEETLQLMLPRRPVKVTLDGAGDLLAKIVYDSKN